MADSTPGAGDRHPGSTPGATLQTPHAERRSVVLGGPAAAHEVRYWSYDVGRARKPLLVMVHGFRGDHHGLQLIAGRLRERHHVVVPDLPGFGRSEPFPNRPHDVAGYVGFLREFVEALTDGTVTDRSGDDGAPREDRVLGIALLGHSFGSVLAAHFAAAHPDLVERLVLVNPIAQPALKGRRAVLSRLTDLYYVLGRALPRGLGRRLLGSSAITDAMSEVLTKSADPVVRRYVRHQHRAYFSAFANRDVLLQTYRASVSHTVAEVATQLSMPTLLVAGAEDDLGSVALQRRMASGIPRHRLEVLEDVGHLIHYEAPDRAAELVHDFLSSPAPELVEPHERLPAADLAAPATGRLTRLLRVVGARRHR